MFQFSVIKEMMAVQMVINNIPNNIVQRHAVYICNFGTALYQKQRSFKNNHAKFSHVTLFFHFL